MGYMKTYRFILITLAVLAVNSGRSQQKSSTVQFADKSYYLVDSLDLTHLGERYIHNLDSFLTIYHSSENDTVKLSALENIANNMVDDTKMKYNDFKC